MSNERFKILYGEEWNAGYARRLKNAVAIFSGCIVDDDDVNAPENLVALSHEGICAYVLKLQMEDSGQRQRQGGEEDVIRVVSGGIAYGSKVFERMCLGRPAGLDAALVERIGWEEIIVGHLNEEVWCRRA